MIRLQTNNHNDKTHDYVCKNGYVIAISCTGCPPVQNAHNQKVCTSISFIYTISFLCRKSISALMKNVRSPHNDGKKREKTSSDRRLEPRVYQKLAGIISVSKLVCTFSNPMSSKNGQSPRDNFDLNLEVLM